MTFLTLSSKWESNCLIFYLVGFFIGLYGAGRGRMTLRFSFGGWKLAVFFGNLLLISFVSSLMLESGLLI